MMRLPCQSFFVLLMLLLLLLFEIIYFRCDFIIVSIHWKPSKYLCNASVFFFKFDSMHTHTHTHSQIETNSSNFIPKWVKIIRSHIFMMLSMVHAIVILYGCFCLPQKFFEFYAIWDGVKSFTLSLNKVL